MTCARRYTRLHAPYHVSHTPSTVATSPATGSTCFSKRVNTEEAPEQATEEADHEILAAHEDDKDQRQQNDNDDFHPAG